MSAALQLQSLQVDTPRGDAPSGSEVDLVLFHGWGSDSRVWRPLLPFLDQAHRIHTLDLPGFGDNADHRLWHDEAALLQALADVLPERAHLVGWSLGGNLALAYAHRYPQRVLSLKLIATNLSFVAREDWPWALPAADFDAFYQLVCANPAAALRRFQQLQLRGAPGSRGLARQLRTLYGNDLVFDPVALADALAWLGRQDQRPLLDCLSPIIDCLLGEADQLVPRAVADSYPLATVLVAAGHLPMLSHPRQLARWIARRDGSPANVTMDKQRIARSFSKAANSYDGAAELQRSVGSVLASLVPERQQGSALDLGCGTGYFLQQFAAAGNGLDWLGGDIAEGMLRRAGARPGVSPQCLVGMDAETLPLADDSLQGIYSNLALQWCPDLDSLFTELRRVIKPGGFVVFSTLVEGTLKELKAAWQQVDTHVHVNHFDTADAWREAAERAGWHIQLWRQESRSRYYGELRELLYELKALGAHNVNSGMSAGLTPKRSWRQLRGAYEVNRLADGRLPASWQVLYGVFSNG